MDTEKERERGVRERREEEGKREGGQARGEGGRKRGRGVQARGPGRAHAFRSYKAEHSATWDGSAGRDYYPNVRSHGAQPSAKQRAWRERAGR